MSHSAIYRARLAIMWVVAPIRKKTVDGALENLQETDDETIYDTARELRYLLGLRDSTYFSGTAGRDEEERIDVFTLSSGDDDD